MVFDECVVGNETVAASSMQRDPIVAHCSELMKLGKMLNKEDIKAGKVRSLFSPTSQSLD